ncbi:MAG: c-type cytochrome [Enhydrobacter sp.]|nr:c-type cytochrome [Enhydrobacter sp.]
MRGRHILGVIGVVAVAIVALLVFAWRPAIAPITPPPSSSFPSELVATGETLARAGNCIECHTAPGGAPNAGGKSLYRRAGTFYSTNITPDPETGIGTWSEAAFTRALREGVSRDGAHLFPSFPYVHYTLLTDADIRALYAYFMTQPPVKAPNRPNTLYFPLDVRPLQVLWKIPFFTPGPYRPDLRRDPRWNRGAYLAEALAACGVCHTDRNLLGAQQGGHPHAGAPIDGWYATSLDISPSPARWTEEEFFTFLRHGDSPPHGVALGPMRSVVRNLSGLSDEDLQAMATYFVSLNTPSGAPLEPKIARALSPVPPTTEKQRAGHKLYMENCASCHGAPGSAPPVARSPLGLSEALWNPYRAYNLVLTILDGIDGRDGLPGNMPGFRDKFSDDDIEALAIYLRTSYTTMPIWGLLAERIKIARNDPVPLP